MNCPACKNPNKENSTECEWCGAELIINQDTLNPSKTILRFVGLHEAAVNTYVFNNGNLIKEIWPKERLHFEIKNSHALPIIQIKAYAYLISIDIPKLDINKNYLITLEYNWIGVWKSKPKSIQEF
jgi:hypothetical protein